MISEKMQDALNGQINAELYSAYLYLSMSAYFESANLPGFAAWMTVQAQEEVAHAMKLYGFVNERSGRVTLAAIDAPPADWPSALSAFQDAYAHEQKVTALIDGLVDLAASEKDTATGVFLQWFVSEQVEEEASALAVVEKLKMVGDAPSPLFMLDKAMGQRKVGGG